MTAAASSVRLANGVALSCLEVGDASAPAVLFLPGPTDSCRSYRPVLDRLPRSVRAVAVSPRGHGDSDKPAHGYRVEDYAADVVQLLDALGIGRSVLAGHSGSCVVVRRVALDHPERVAGLVLEASPSTLRGDPRLVAFVESVVAGLEDPIEPDLARAFVGDTSGAGVSPSFVEELVQDVLKVPAHVWRETFASLLEADDSAELGRIAAPALLVWGSDDDVVPRDAQEHLVAALPDAELVVWAGLGHTPRWEDPARFAATVAAFVAHGG